MKPQNMSQRFALFIVLVLSLSTVTSCKEEVSQYEIELLSGILTKTYKENMKMVNVMNACVLRKGKRKDDVILFEKVKFLMDQRKAADLPHDRLDSFLLEDFKYLDNYVGTLDSIQRIEGLSKWNKSWELQKESITYFQNTLKEPFNASKALKLLIVLANMERELLSSYAEYLGAFCEWGIDFNFNLNQPELLMNQPVEMIISPCEFKVNDSLAVDFVDLSLSYQEQPIDNFEFRQIGSAGYLRFIPLDTGKYQFDAIFHINEWGYDDKQPISTTIQVQ